MAARQGARDVSEWGRTLVWVCLVGTAALFSARTTEGFELPKAALVVATALVLGSALSAAALVGPRPPARRWRGLVSAARRDPLGAGVLGTLAAATLSTAFALSPLTSLRGAQGSFAGLVTLGAFAVLFFGTRRLCPDVGAARGVLSGAVVGLGLAVAYGIAQLAGLDPLRWEAPIAFAGVSRVFSTMGHPNSLAQLLAMGVPLAVFFLWTAARARRWGEAVVLGLITAGAVSLVLLTLSRAGVLALVAAVVAAAWGAPGLRSRGRLALAALGLVALAALAVLLASALDPGGGLDGLTARLSGEAGLGHGGTELRRHLWAGAWAAFRESPVHGVGVDGLFLAFGRHRTAAAWAAEWGETPLKAHNQVLEVLATRGLVGGAALALMLLGLGRDALRALRGPDDGRGLARAAVAALAAFLVHNLFHFPTVSGMTLAGTLAAVLSMLARRTDEGNDDERPASAPLVLSTKAGLAALVAAAVALHAVVLTPLRADILVQAATVVLRTDPGRAVGLAREAVRLDPSRDLLWLRLSAALHSHGLTTTDPPARAALLGDAREAAARGVALVPANAYAHAHLGTLLADLERETPPLAARDDVERAFGQALALDPLNADIQMAAAHAALVAGDLAGARARAQACRDVYPRFAPPLAALGAVALAEGRRLAEAGQAEAAFSQLQEAARLLDEALGGEWHGDERARAAAAANRAAVDTRP